MASSRVRRGRESEEAVAAYLRENGWPDARRRPASLSGADIENTPDLSFEVKARRELDLPGWLRQAWNHGGLPIVVSRPDGYGPQTVSQWPAILPLRVLVQLLMEAGYAPEPEPKDDVQVSNIHTDNGEGARALRREHASADGSPRAANQVPRPRRAECLGQCQPGKAGAQLPCMRVRRRSSSGDHGKGEAGS
jgi:hypothetical protein